MNFEKVKTITIHLYDSCILILSYKYVKNQLSIYKNSTQIKKKLLMLPTKYFITQLSQKFLNNNLSLNFNIFK